MSLRIVFLTACSALAFATAPATAQTLRDVPVPAEFPPTSFKAAQYVDSKGCVFVRAGVGDNVSWVPRMTRMREPLCGFAPTFASAKPSPAPQTLTAAAPQARAAAPAPASPQNAAPAKAPIRAAAPTSRPTPAPVVVAAAPTPVASSPAARAPEPARKARTIAPPDPARTACANMTGISAAYIVQHNGSPVRCGPQTSPHVTYASGSHVTTIVAAPPPPGTRATPGSVPPGTRVAPARVYASQKTSLAGISVPEGMKPVWEDDRLNPLRAHQTFEGKARMEVMWTNTVPRRLIDRRTGADVIHKYPGLQPPYTSFDAQRAAGVSVATRGIYVPDPITVRSASAATRAATPTVSTRSAPARAKTDQTPSASAPARPSYAQAGLFADPAEARAAAQRIAGAGLPARKGTLSRDGRDLTLVLAGPFPSREEAARGAARLRALGFGDVRLR